MVNLLNIIVKKIMYCNIMCFYNNNYFNNDNDDDDDDNFISVSSEG